MNQAPLSPVSALVAHVEPLIAERRILVVGSAERSAAEHLLDRGARLVQVLDPDPKRVAHAAAHNNERRVTYAQLTDSSLRDGSFDLVLVEDVELAEDLQGLVHGIQRAMSNRGLALFCMRNSEGSTGLLGATPGAIEYDELADAVDERFESVLMMGQSPFLGYSVVQFGLDGPPEPALDNAYLNQEAEAPDFYIALCGTEEAISEVQLEDMSIVQLSAARFVSDSETSHRDRERRTARRADTLEAELKSLRKRGGDSEIDRLTQELEQRDSWIRELESRSEKADARADDAQASVEELEQELEDTHATLLNTREDADRAVAERNKAVEAQKKLEAESKVAAAKPAGSTAEDLQEIEDLEGEVEDLTKLLRTAKERQKKAEQKNAQLEKKLADATHHADEIKHQNAGLEALEEELTNMDKLSKNQEEKFKEKQAAFERLEKRLAEQEKELDELHEQMDETEDLLHRARSAPAQPSGPSAEEVEQDVRDLEAQLKERGRRIAELETQLRNLELYAKTLKAETIAPPADAPVTDSEELETLAKALAEREADLVAAEWTIGQLKQAALKS